MLVKLFETKETAAFELGKRILQTIALSRLCFLKLVTFRLLQLKYPPPDLKRLNLQLRHPECLWWTTITNSTLRLRPRCGMVVKTGCPAPPIAFLSNPLPLDAPQWLSPLLEVRLGRIWWVCSNSNNIQPYNPLDPILAGQDTFVGMSAITKIR